MTQLAIRVISHQFVVIWDNSYFVSDLILSKTHAGIVNTDTNSCTKKLVLSYFNGPLLSSHSSQKLFWSFILKVVPKSSHKSYIYVNLFFADDTLSDFYILIEM